MLNEAQVQTLTTQVLWAAFALALLFGAIAQRTQFCTMGALADIVTTSAHYGTKLTAKGDQRTRHGATRV